MVIAIFFIVIEMFREFIGLIGAIRLADSMNQTSQVLQQYICVFFLCVALNWNNMPDKQYKNVCLMEVFYYGLVVYFVSDIIGQSTGYISIKMIGSGLTAFPILALLASYFNNWIPLPI